MERDLAEPVRACSARGFHLIASARISDRSGRRHVRLAGLFRDALARDVTIAAQTDADAERFRAIGVPAAAVHVTGNVKFDLEIPEDVRRAGAHIRAEFAHRPVWVAGSTHEREEDIVIDAHERVRAARNDAIVLLVPRHPIARRSEVVPRRESQLVCVRRRSVAADTSVLLVDTSRAAELFSAANARSSAAVS